MPPDLIFLKSSIPLLNMVEYHFEYGFTVHFLGRPKEPLVSISDEWLYIICLTSLLIGIFKMHKCVVFSLTSFATLKYYVIKAREMFSFLPLINNSVTIELSCSILSISTIISSKTISILHFLWVVFFNVL